MKFAFRIKLSTYKRLIKNGHTFEKIRKLDFRASFYGASFDGASFDRASFNRASFNRASFYGASFDGASFGASFDGASFDGASLNISGIGIQLKIGRYRASLVGKYISVGCVTRRIKDAMKGSEADYANAHDEALQYRDAVQRAIKAAFAMKRAARLRVK